MCAKLPCAPNSILNGSDHAEYTRKSLLTEIRKVYADRNKLCTGKEWRP